MAIGSFEPSEMRPSIPANDKLPQAETNVSRREIQSRKSWELRASLPKKSKLGRRDHDAAVDTINRMNQLHSKALLAKWEIGLMVAFGLLMVFRFWISPLNSSLWLDETGTVWAINGSFHDLVEHLRTYKFPQMPLYCLVTWGWVQLAGKSELALRMPSVVLSILTTVVFYQLGKQLLGMRRALYAVIVLLSFSHFTFAGVDARPYAYAMFMVVVSYYALARWMETGALRDVIAHGIASGIMLQFSYFFAAALVAQAVFIVVAYQRKWIRLRASILISPILIFMIAAPLLSIVFKILPDNALHIIATRPSWTELGIALVPPRWAVAAVSGTLLTIFWGIRCGGDWSVDRTKIALVLCWAIVPALFLFLYSLVSASPVFVPRYLLSQVQGLSLVAGFVLGSLRPAMWRTSIATVLALLSLTSTGTRLTSDHYIEDWRGALATVREIRSKDPDIPVLMASSYVESVRLPMPVSDLDKRWMLSYLEEYPAGGPVALLPFEVNHLNHEYVDGVLSKATPARRILVLIPANTLLIQWIQGRLDEEFTANLIHGNPVVLLFERK